MGSHEWIEWGTHRCERENGFVGELVYRAEQEVWRWCPWVCGDTGRLVNKITTYIYSRSVDVGSTRPRARPRIEWIESVKRALNVRWMSLDERRVIMWDRNEWRAVVNT